MENPPMKGNVLRERAHRKHSVAKYPTVVIVAPEPQDGPKTGYFRFRGYELPSSFLWLKNASDEVILATLETLERFKM
jgi:hypothetical protein